MSDWSSPPPSEPSAWYEHEVDETDYPRSNVAATTTQQQQQQPSYTHHSQHQHANGEYTQVQSSRASQSVRDEHRSSDDRRGGGDRDRDHRRGERQHDRDRGDRTERYGAGGVDRERSYSDRDRTGGGGGGEYTNRPERHDRRDREPREHRERRDNREPRDHNRDRERGDGGGNREYRDNRDRPERQDRGGDRPPRDHDRRDNRRNDDRRNNNHDDRDQGDRERYNSQHAQSTVAHEEEYTEQPEAEAAGISDEEDEEPCCPLCMENLDATDKQFKPCKCGYQVCLWCFPAGTPITTASGMSVPIEQVANGSLILSYAVPEAGATPDQTQATGLVHARSMRLVKRGVKPLMELTLEDGQTVRCTPDHRLLVSDQSGAMRWTPAEKIDLEQERVRVTVRGPTTIDVESNSSWSIECARIAQPFELTTDAARSRLLAFARVCGYAWSSPSTSSSITLPSSFDAVAFRSDLALAADMPHSCEGVQSTQVMLPSWMRDVLATDSEQQMPAFICRADTPREMQREFVAAALSAALIASPSSAVSSLQFNLSTAQLSALASISTSGTSLITTDRQLLAFADNIGLRYSHSAAAKLAVQASYLRAASKAESFESYCTRVDATSIFYSPSSRATYSQRIVSRSLLAVPAPVYDLVVQSSSKSADVHSFVAGGVIAHNCFHHINERLGGNCPACRRTYDTTGQMAADPAVLETIAAKAASGGVKRPSKKAEESAAAAARPTRKTSSVASGQVPLVHVRVLQRNLLYVVGLPVAVAKDELLKSKPYFGKFGKIVKIALGLKGDRDRERREDRDGRERAAGRQTCSCYVTYKRGVDAVEAIKAVNGCILLGCLLKATYGTSKYCANWLRQSPCNNPSCLYLHELAEPRDCTTKDELSQFLLETQPPTVNPQAIATNGLPGASSGSAMIPGSAAAIPLIPMSRQNSVLDAPPRDDDSTPVPASSSSSTPGPSASVGGGGVSSWASLAGSRGVSGLMTSQPGSVQHAPVEPSPASEVLNPDQIIYIVPPHLRAASGAAASTRGKGLGSRSNSNASTAASATTVASPSAAAAVESKKPIAAAENDEEPDREAESPYIQSPNGPGAAGLDSPSSASLGPSSLILPSPASSPALPLSLLPLSSPTLMSSLPSPAPSPVGSRPPPGFGGMMSAAGAAPTAATGGAPPGMGKLPSIAPPAISQLQAPPGHASLGPPGVGGLKLGGGPPAGFPPQQQQVLPGSLPGGQGPQILSHPPHTSTPAVSLQKLVSAFPAIDPAILALMVQGIPSLNHNMQRVQEQNQQMQQHQQQQQQHGHPSQQQHGGLSHASSPSNGAQQQHLGAPVDDAFARHQQQQSHGPPGHGPPPGHHAHPQQQQQQHDRRDEYFQSQSGGFGDRGMPGFGPPPSQQQYGQLSPHRRGPDGNPQQQHDRAGPPSQQQQGAPQDWELLADEDRPDSNGPSTANTWSQWGQRLLAANEDKRPPQTHMSAQDERSTQQQHNNNMMRSDQLREREAMMRAEREREQQHHQQQQQHQQRDSSRLWNSQPPSQHQQQLSQQQQHWQSAQDSALGVGALHLGPQAASSSASTAPTSRYGFALEDDQDLLGGGGGGGNAGARSTFGQPPPQQQQQQRGPPSIAGLGGGFGAPRNDAPNGWQQQERMMQERQQQQPPQNQPWPQDDYANIGGGFHSGFHSGLDNSQPFGAPQQPSIAGPRARAPLSVQQRMNAGFRS